MTEKQKAEMLALADHIEDCVKHGIEPCLLGDTALIVIALRAAAPSPHPTREEPVAWLGEYSGHLDCTIYRDTALRWKNVLKRNVTPLYAAPPPAGADAVREALKPFAAVAEYDIGETEADADIYRPMSKNNHAPLLTVGDLRRARAALFPAPPAARG